MSSSDEIIGHANPHTVKKFDLIEKYVEAWAHILLLNQYCTGLVFIDCMSNSGEYVDDDGKQVFGTPVRVAKYLRQIAGQYFGKQIDLYFSDLSAAKTAHLESLMPGETRNFRYTFFKSSLQKVTFCPDLLRSTFAAEKLLLLCRILPRPVIPEMVVPIKSPVPFSKKAYILRFPVLQKSLIKRNDH